MSISGFTTRMTLSGMSALALAATAPSLPAHAQDYDQYAGGGEVEVYAAPRLERDSVTGAPIEIARTSRAVYYGDLNLNTYWGARALRERIERTAVRLCSDLDFQMGVVPEDSNQDCIVRTVRDAMYRAPIRDDLRYRVSSVSYGYDY